MRDTPAARVAALMARQQRLLRLAAAGATPLDLAERLGLSPARARREFGGLLGALGVRTGGEAALLWWGSRDGARAEVRPAASVLNVRRVNNGVILSSGTQC